MNSIEWRDNSVTFIDQTKLPLIEDYITTKDYNIIADAIKSLRIRGAPLIGIAAAYGVALACLENQKKDKKSFINEIKNAIATFKVTRPTAVNLFWALDRVEKFINEHDHPELITHNIVNEAIKIHLEDQKMCELIGIIGQEVIPENSNILTHCNTGALATGGEGTALSVIKHAKKFGKKIHVYVDETRPLLQGARLTTWELIKSQIDFTLITDNAAAYLMQNRKIDLIITGADRVIRNGYAANKIGTYNLAVLAKHHNIPFYIAVPSSSIDLSINDSKQIIIEERSASEVRTIQNVKIVTDDVNVYNPAFDITPPELITGIITEKRIYHFPYQDDFLV